MNISSADFLHFVEEGSASEVRDVVDCGVDVNHRDGERRTPLMRAASVNPDAEVLRVLLAAGADLDARDEQRANALMLAARHNPEAAATETLLAAGASGALRDNAGRSAFDRGRGNKALRDSDALRRLETAAPDAAAEN